jgi:nitrate reductase gamma subunit
MTDLLLFGLFPYVALTLAVGGGLWRYLADRYSWSSQSSQFLESRALFWGSLPWHYPVLAILLAHLLAFLFPAAWGGMLGRPMRLYLLEAAGLALGASTVAGVLLLAARRALSARVAAVTTAADWLLLLLLLVQAASGVWIAFTLRWGSAWYLHTAVPWLWSLLKLNPRVEYLAALPVVVKVHAVNAFLLVALFPFTRLVHAASIPLAYLGRAWQVVIWNRQPPARSS